MFVFTGGRHTCAIKSGIGWADGVDYTDRLFCFGRNEEGQLNIPNGLVNDAWETVYDVCTHIYNHTKNWHIFFADTRDGPQRAAERRTTQKTWFAGETKAAQSCQVTYPSLLLARILFGCRFLWEVRMPVQYMQSKTKLKILVAILFAGVTTSEFHKMDG